MALLFNLDLSELAIILIGAILVFGRNLPQVAMRGAAQFVKLRRQLMQVWREAGFEDELRKAQRELESSVPKLPPPKSFFDAPPPQPKPAGSSGSGAAAALAAAHADAGSAVEHPGPDEDPDQRPDWEHNEPYSFESDSGEPDSGPSEEEKRASGGPAEAAAEEGGSESTGTDGPEANGPATSGDGKAD